MYELFNNINSQKIDNKKQYYLRYMKEKAGDEMFGNNYINKAFDLENAIQCIKYEELDKLKSNNLPFLIYMEYNETLVKDESYFNPIPFDQYYYEFKGIVSISQTLKDLVYYDKYSEHWYSFLSHSWQDDFSFDNIGTKYFIYLRKTSKHKEQELYINELQNIDTEIDFTKKNVDYENTFMWFYNCNKKLLLKYSECFAKIFKNNEFVITKIKEETNKNKSRRPNTINKVPNPCILKLN
jgi:hypothetical protein